MKLEIDDGPAIGVLFIVAAAIVVLFRFPFLLRLQRRMEQDTPHNAGRRRCEAMIAVDDVQFLKLLLRSPDAGDGWRDVSPACWPLIQTFGSKPLIEIDHENRRIRLSPDGQVVVRYAL